MNVNIIHTISDIIEWIFKASDSKSSHSKDTPLIKQKIKISNEILSFFLSLLSSICGEQPSWSLLMYYWINHYVCHRKSRSLDNSRWRHDPILRTLQAYKDQHKVPTLKFSHSDLISNINKLKQLSEKQDTGGVELDSCLINNWIKTITRFVPHAIPYGTIDLIKILDKNIHIPYPEICSSCRRCCPSNVFIRPCEQCHLEYHVYCYNMHQTNPVCLKCKGPANNLKTYTDEDGKSILYAPFDQIYPKSENGTLILTKSGFEDIKMEI